MAEHDALAATVNGPSIYSSAWEDNAAVALAEVERLRSENALLKDRIAELQPAPPRRRKPPDTPLAAPPGPSLYPLTSGDDPMASVSDTGLAVFKSREGVRLAAYRDSVGVPTIGWGHTAGVKMGQTINYAQAEAFLRQDIASHAAPILAAIKVPVAEHEADALVSIAFNIGIGSKDGKATKNKGFCDSEFLKALNAGKPRAEVARLIMNWLSPPEIKSRRRAERDQFLTPYTVSLPKARFTDVRPIGVPVIPVETKPVAPLPAPVPAPPVSAPVAAPAPAKPAPGALEPVKVASKPSWGSWLADWLMVRLR